jgi:AcrR family transcriptional regulator
MSIPVSTPKPLRADARRNRERIVEAARAAFAEHGLDAQMDDIARRADVGVGTLYRHFPTKDALVRAIVQARMEAMADEGRRLAEEGGDAWEAFAAFIRHCGLFDHALTPVVSTQPPETFRDAAQESGLIEVGRLLLGRAQEAGAVRPDTRVEDIPLTMCGLGAVLRNWDEDAGRRYLELVLGGFRTSDAPPLPD